MNRNAGGTPALPGLRMKGAKEEDQVLVNRVIGARLGGKSGIARMEALRRGLEIERAEEREWARVENRVLKAVARMRGISDLKFEI